MTTHVWVVTLCCDDPRSYLFVELSSAKRVVREWMIKNIPLNPELFDLLEKFEASKDFDLDFLSLPFADGRRAIIFAEPLH